MGRSLISINEGCSSQKAKLLIYLFVYILTLICIQEIWIMA